MNPASETRGHGRARVNHDHAALVGRARLGDELAWRSLTKELHGTIRAVTRSLRLSDADAGDVEQATWLLLVENLDTLAEPEKVRSWVATTARRLGLRHIKGAARVVPVGDDIPERAADDGDFGHVRHLVQAERAAALWQAFDGLRARDQRLLHLTVANPAANYQEVSRELDLPIGSIGPMRGRALDRLRDRLHAAAKLDLVDGDVDVMVA